LAQFFLVLVRPAITGAATAKRFGADLEALEVVRAAELNPNLCMAAVGGGEEEDVELEDDMAGYVCV
jgi:hypothetical protein